MDPHVAAAVRRMNIELILRFVHHVRDWLPIRSNNRRSHSVLNLVAMRIHELSATRAQSACHTCDQDTVDPDANLRGVHRAPIRAFGLEHHLGVRLTKSFVDACTYVVQPTQKQHEPRWTDLEATDQRRTEEVLLEDDKGPPLDERELVSLRAARA